MAANVRPTLPPDLKIVFVTSPTYAAQLARVKFAAFQDNELNKLMYPISANETDTIAWLEEREWRELTKKKTMVVAIVNTTKNDEVIACAKWNIPPRLHGVTGFVGNRPPVVAGESGNSKSDLPPYPQGANIALQTCLRNILDQHRAKCYDSEHDYILRSLYTHPDYQGRGCASVILQWGIQQANIVGAKIYLESSPQAHGLYAKHGWRDVDESVIDLTQFGGKGLYPLSVMIREPSQAELPLS